MPLSERCSHRKTCTLTVTRTTHEVGVWNGLSAVALVETLQDHVPPDALVVDIGEADNGDTVLLFVFETPTADPPSQ